MKHRFRTMRGLAVLLALAGGCDEQAAPTPAPTPIPPDQTFDDSLPEYEEIELATGLLESGDSQSSEGDPTWRSLVISPNGLHVAYFKQGFLYRDGEKLHAVRPLYERWERPIFTPGGHHLLMATMGDDDKYRLYVDGQPGPDAFSEPIAYTPSLLKFTPDGRHFVTTARDRESGERVLLNGKALPDPEGHVGRALAISDDGTQAIYVVRGHQEVAIKINGDAVWTQDQELSPVDDTLRFSPDGKRWAVAFDGRGGQFLVVDGQAWAAHERIFMPTFSPDSRRVACLAIDKDGRGSFMVDGEAWPWFDKVYPMGQERGFTFSPDGQRVGAVIGDEPKIVFVDGQRQPDGYRNGPVRVCFSGDSKHFAYRGNQGMVMDGNPLPGGNPIHFTGQFIGPDRDQLIYANYDQRGQITVYNSGVPGPTYAEVTGMMASPDGRHGVYIGKRDDPLRHVVVIDGEPGSSFRTVHHESMTFSQHGNVLAYAAGDRRDPGTQELRGDFTVLNGELFDSPSLPYPIHVSPYGSHFYLLGNDFYVDGKPLPLKDGMQVIHGSHRAQWLNDHTLVYLGRRGDTLYRVIHRFR